MTLKKVECPVRLKLKSLKKSINTYLKNIQILFMTLKKKKVEQVALIINWAWVDQMLQKKKLSTKKLNEPIMIVNYK